MPSLYLSEPALNFVNNQSTQTNSGGSGSNTTTTTTVTTETQNVGDRVVDVSLSPYARERWVQVRCSGLRPNTDYLRLYWDEDLGLDELDTEIIFGSFVDDNGNALGISQNWDQYKGSTAVDPVSGITLQFIKTDQYGNFSCAIKVPPNEPVGLHSVRVVEEGEIWAGIGGQNTTANSLYQAHGLDVQVSETIVTTQIIQQQNNFSTPEPEDPRPPFRDCSIFPGGICPADPLAQSFRTGTENVYISSVDLYFQTRPADGSGGPVLIQFREMINGYPGPKIIPGSTVVKPWDEITISNDGSGLTRFTFTDPVYLQSNTDYCFVIIAYSTAYELWHSELGQRDVRTNTMVDRQPLLGSMFLSQNNVTWTAEQNFDLKFKINKCNFSSDGVNEYINFKPLTGAQAYSLIQKTSLFMLGQTQIIHPNTDIRWYYKYDQTTDGPTSTSLGLTSDWQLFKPGLNLDLQNMTSQVRLRLEFSGGTLSPLINTERSGLVFLRNLNDGAYITRTMNFTAINPESLRPNHVRGVFLFKAPSNTRIKLYGAINDDLNDNNNVNWRHICTVESSGTILDSGASDFEVTTAYNAVGPVESVVTLDDDTGYYTGQLVSFTNLTGNLTSSTELGDPTQNYYIRLLGNSRAKFYTTQDDANNGVNPINLTQLSDTGTVNRPTNAEWKQASLPNGYTEGEFNYDFRSALEFMNKSGINEYKFKMELQTDIGYEAYTPLIKSLRMIGYKRDT